jgi:hypothetical protein
MPESSTERSSEIKGRLEDSFDEVVDIWAEIETITSEMTPEEFEAFTAAFENAPDDR